MQDIYYVKDLEQLKVLSDPLRVKILWELDQGAQTGKMLSIKLNLPASKMRYHLTALEKAGLAEIERTEVINGIVQKFYRPIAKEISLEKVSPLINKHDNPLKGNALKENALESLKRTQNLLNNQYKDILNTDELIQHFISVCLSADDFKIVKEKLTELALFMKEHEQKTDTAKLYHVNITGFPTNEK
ncbi:Helix-turn-helix domain-containing protein [Lentibacillus halodurans]|uniref:Helix-turn-helix domain-containing protein n=1 Tax=Lentibacillus halodurans TaxID=237679 RepID=A0A1I0X915_9BACI|nr:helix-turn-helix domain-containing protein [Lentibacillus halodurans]SFA97532.1 Helix-turn-helix domain-containing protein [Lentibacillus halodurans]